MSTTFLRADQAQIHAGVNGVNFPGTASWATYDGGDVEAEDVFTRPGGMLPGENLGGPSKRQDVTVTRQYTPDLHAYIIKLENACGNATAWASYTILDADGNPNGDAIRVSGILKTVQKPKFDANTSSAVFLGLVIACDTEATPVSN